MELGIMDLWRLYLGGKHTLCVCNFSRKYLWRMAVTHHCEPQEIIAAEPDLRERGANTNCTASVLLQSTEKDRGFWRRTYV